MGTGAREGTTAVKNPYIYIVQFLTIYINFRILKHCSPILVDVEFPDVA